MARPRFPLWLPSLALALACGETTTPTQPDADLTASAAAVAAPNTWTPRAPIPVPHTGFAASAAPNAAGQWIAYIFGGMDEDGTGFPGYGYNVETDT